MVFEGKIRINRYGVSTILIAIIIIVAVAGTAAVAYIALPGDGEETIAPGTWSKAEIVYNGKIN